MWPPPPSDTDPYQDTWDPQVVGMLALSALPTTWLSAAACPLSRQQVALFPFIQQREVWSQPTWPDHRILHEALRYVYEASAAKV